MPSDRCANQPWNIDVELDFVPIRIADVQAVRHVVVRGTDEGHVRFHQPRKCGPQFIVAIADLEPEVIQANASAYRNRSGSGTDLNEEQFVMSSATGERRSGHPWHARRDQLPTEHL